MSADSGLAVYNQIADIPAYHQMEVDYMDLCTPEWFDKDPEIFFGFWGKCYNDYMDKTPHSGHNILLKWATTYFNGLMPNVNPGYSLTSTPLRSYFVFSSNVDCHIEKSGFPRDFVDEVHSNAIEWHCVKQEDEKSEIFPNLGNGFRFSVNLTTMRANLSTVPRCSICDGFLRPRVLMFGDFDWIGTRDTDLQNWEKKVRKETKEEGKKLVIIEIGCGKNVQTVRRHSEIVLAENNGKLIRINLEFPDGDVPEKTIGIRGKGKDSLEKIDAWINKLVEEGFTKGDMVVKEDDKEEKGKEEEKEQKAKM